MIFPNPLTIEEKLSVGRLYCHDFNTTWGGLSSRVQVSVLEQEPIDEDAMKFEYRVYTIVKTMAKLLGPELNYSWNREDWDAKKYLNSLAGDNVAVSLKADLTNLSLTIEPVIAVLLNWIKNAKNAAYDPLAPVEVIVEESLFPHDALIMPDSAWQYDQFIAFRVRDKGPGFPPCRKLEEMFQHCPPEGEHGFGLYFSGLVSKAYRAPIGLVSAPGETTLTLYHPLIRGFQE